MITSQRSLRYLRPFRKKLLVLNSHGNMQGITPSHYYFLSIIERVLC